MATWPASLPQEIHQQDFQLSAPEGAIRSDMDTGKPFQRQRFTAAVQEFNARIWVDTEQYDTLIAFWKNTTAHGAIEFDWKHPVTGDPATVRFVATNPINVTAVSGQLYQISMSLELIP